MEMGIKTQPEAFDNSQPRPDLRSLPPGSAGIKDGAEPGGGEERVFWHRWSVLPLTILTTLGAIGLSLVITIGAHLLIDPSRMGIASILAVICPLVIAPPLCFYWFSLIKRHQRTQQELLRANRELAAALSQVKELTGLLPICASCKRIRDDQGYWTRLETYLTRNSKAEFTHGICPECRRKLYPELTAVTDDPDRPVK
jgi:hypothetical protein